MLLKSNGNLFEGLTLPTAGETGPKAVSEPISTKYIWYTSVFRKAFQKVKVMCYVALQKLASLAALSRWVQGGHNGAPAQRTGYYIPRW